MLPRSHTIAPLAVLLPVTACAPERLGSLMRCGRYDFHAVETGFDTRLPFERCGSAVGTWGIAWFDEPEPVFSVSFLPRIRWGDDDLDVSLNMGLDGSAGLDEPVEILAAGACVSNVWTGDADCADLSFGEVSFVDRIDDHDPDYIYLKIDWDLEWGEVGSRDTSWFRAKGRDWVGLLISD